tara:strand:- start:1255 stop:1734 length:480 start_codon:yes stop_codon:yes gene_type:complete
MDFLNLKLKGDNNFLCLCCLTVIGYLIYLVLYNRPIIEGLATRRNCKAYDECTLDNPFDCLDKTKNIRLTHNLNAKHLTKCRNKNYDEEVEEVEEDEDTPSKPKFKRFFDKKPSKKPSKSRKPRSKNYAKSHLKMIDRTIDRLDDTFDDLMAEYPKCLE